MLQICWFFLKQNSFFASLFFEGIYSFYFFYEIFKFLRFFCSQHLNLSLYEKIARIKKLNPGIGEEQRPTAENEGMVDWFLLDFCAKLLHKLLYVNCSSSSSEVYFMILCALWLIPRRKVWGAALKTDVFAFLAPKACSFRFFFKFFVITCCKNSTASVCVRNGCGIGLYLG